MKLQIVMNDKKRYGNTISGSILDWNIRKGLLKKMTCELKPDFRGK